MRISVVRKRCLECIDSYINEMSDGFRQSWYIARRDAAKNWHRFSDYHRLIYPSFVFLMIYFTILMVIVSRDIGSIVIAIGIVALVTGLMWMRAPKDSWKREIAPELISISLGVMVLDQLYQFRAIQQEKRAIIRQMASPDSGFAIEAARQAATEGWLGDGSLRRADLGYANLASAQLRYADFEGALLYKATLRRADLNSAILKGANLYRSDLRESNLANANLRNADLLEADLSGANLQNADFTNASLISANLEGATHVGFIRRTMPRSIIRQGTILVTTQSPGYSIIFRNADLTAANLKGVDLSEAILEGAIYNDQTIWPEDFDHALSGAIYEWRYVEPVLDEGDWLQE